MEREMVNYLRMLAIRQLRELDKHIRLVVIHPNYVRQHLILEEFVQGNAVYVRFEGQALTQIVTEEQINSAVAQQCNGSGLDEAVLILDECDRVDEFVLEELVTEWLGRETLERIILLSREIPRCILENQAMCDQIVFVPDDRSLMLWNYAQVNSDQTLLEVRAFGDGQVLLDGKRLDNWGGMLPRALFFYLVDRGMVTRDDIFKTFWPEKSLSEATNVFHVTKRKINEILGISLTTYGGGYYRLSPKIQLSYDAVLFTEMLQGIAIASDDETVDLLCRAKMFYCGDFLSTLDMPWVEKRRHELGEEYGDALENLAETKVANGEKKAALGHYLQALILCPPNEKLAMKVMSLYHELELTVDALAVYEWYIHPQGNRRRAASSSPEMQDLVSILRKALKKRDN
jgi:DNA-binding SARP family transcriptional activator